MDLLFYLCLVFVMLFCLFIAALWSPEGKMLTSWLLLVMFIVILLLSHPGTGVVLDCIDFWSLLSFFFCPDHLASLVPATVGSASTYPLRNSSDLQTLHTNYSLYYTSFLPSVARDWNERSEQIKIHQSTKTDWILPWVHHLDTITHVKDLVKYIKLD